MKRLFAVSLFVVMPLMALAQTPPTQPKGVPHPGTEKPASCAPSLGLNFICGLDQPEDLIQIPGSRWLVASAMGEGGGISLIDAQAKKARRFYTGTAKPDTALYPDCAQPAHFNSHGLALRPGASAGTYRLYAVAHVPFESIQVFGVDARGANLVSPGPAVSGCLEISAPIR